MPKILLPFDGSDSANSALAHILDRHKWPAHAELYLINVQPPATAGQLAHVVALDLMRAMRLKAGQESASASPGGPAKRMGLHATHASSWESPHTASHALPWTKAAR